MIRSLIAMLVVAAGLAGLGSDLAHTAYTAAQTARTVVLPPANA